MYVVQCRAARPIFLHTYFMVLHPYSLFHLSFLYVNFLALCMNNVSDFSLIMSRVACSLYLDCYILLLFQLVQYLLQIVFLRHQLTIHI